MHSKLANLNKKYKLKKMKYSDKKLIDLGCFIDSTRRQMHISRDLLCAEIQCSKSTYYSV